MPHSSSVLATISRAIGCFQYVVMKFSHHTSFRNVSWEQTWSVPRKTKSWIKSASKYKHTAQCLIAGQSLWTGRRSPHSLQDATDWKPYCGTARLLVWVTGFLLQYLAYYAITKYFNYSTEEHSLPVRLLEWPTQDTILLPHGTGFQSRTLLHSPAMTRSCALICRDWASS